MHEYQDTGNIYFPEMYTIWTPLYFINVALIFNVHIKDFPENRSCDLYQPHVLV